uniref:Peptidase_S9 domain-containing protein n=1 Tax=Syphacia muris TaxID=451379 RepID=A0A0N5AS64_9BILA
MKTISEYGTWSSSIDAYALISGNCRTICELQVSNGYVFWTEQNFDGRCIICRFKDGILEQWTPPEQSKIILVHEYGGGSFIVVDEIVYFVTLDGIFIQARKDSEPKVLVRSSKNSRFADFCYWKEFLYAVNEVHLDDGSGTVEDVLVKISLDGSVTKIISGADFYACPRVSPNGKYIAWMQWNSPFMPWDDTQIKVAKLSDDGCVGEVVSEISKSGVNFHGLQWSPKSELYVISDETGWWNVYSIDVTGNKLGQNVYKVDREIGTPPWVFGDRQFATSNTGMLLNVSGQLVFKSKAGEVRKLSLKDYEEFSHLSLWESYAFCIASGPRRSTSVIRIHLDSEKVDVIRESIDSKKIEEYDISSPRNLTFESWSTDVSGWFYPPYSRSYEAPKQSLPPVILMAHGGPTAKASNSLSMKVQFFTSRGFAVFDVNYRGSTGYGTKFRNKLQGRWGIVDRDDMINAARYLVNKSMVDFKKVCIMGSSAGGLSVLNAVMDCGLFAAAASLYGVSDLVGLCKNTHKFERAYNEQLIGSYPQELNEYVSRSPAYKSEELMCPTCFFHGTRDVVVPIIHSLHLHESLKSRSIPTALVIFPGEGHGFRGHDAIKMSIAGVYYFFCRILEIAPSVSVEV